MAEMKLMGYYIVRPVTRPSFCTLDCTHILTVSEYEFDCVFPDLTKCYFINYPQSVREEYAKQYGLDDAAFVKMCQLTNEFINEHRMAIDCRFGSLEDARAMLRFTEKTDGHRIIGIYTEESIAAEFGDEYFSCIPLTECDETGITIGCDILGSECIGGDFRYCCYLVNGLDKVIAEKAEIIIDHSTGLLQNPFDEVRGFADMIQGMGEPVVWTPFEIREFGKD